MNRRSQVSLRKAAAVAAFSAIPLWGVQGAVRGGSRLKLELGPLRVSAKPDARRGGLRFVARDARGAQRGRLGSDFDVAPVGGGRHWLLGGYLSQRRESIELSDGDGKALRLHRQGRAWATLIEANSVADVTARFSIAGRVVEEATFPLAEFLPPSWTYYAPLEHGGQQR